MINFTNIDLESSGVPHGRGVITEMQIKMNNTSDVREAVVEAKNIYDSINKKLKSESEKPKSLS